jgi:hypothetical protein
MKLLGLLPMLLLPALFLGDTCITKVYQKGPFGPWLGEVVNTSDILQPDVHVFGTVYDSNGQWTDNFYAETCPFDLSPGEKGYFTKDFQTLPAYPNPAPPLHADSLESYTCQAHSLTTDVNLRIVSMSDDHKSALVEARNDSQNTYLDLGLCGVSFTPSGEAQDVVINSELPSRILRPGDKVQFPLGFNTPVTGQVDLAVKSSYGTYNIVLDSAHFKVTTSKVIQTDSGRQLQVVGEVSNDSRVDLDDARFEAFLESSPNVRASGRVGSYGYASDQAKNEFPGTGFVPANGKAPFRFSLPLGPHDSTHVEFAGLVANRSSSVAVSVTPANISSRQLDSNTVEYSATLTNPFDKSLELFYCWEFRGSNGRLKDASCMSTCRIDPYPPYNTWNVSAQFQEVEPTDSADIVEYLRPGTCVVVPPSDPGPPPCSPP